MKAYKVTLYILDEDDVPPPDEWDWAVLDIAPRVAIISSESVTLEETGWAE